MEPFLADDFQIESHMMSEQTNTILKMIPLIMVPNPWSRWFLHGERVAAASTTRINYPTPVPAADLAERVDTLVDGI